MKSFHLSLHFYSNGEAKSHHPTHLHMRSAAHSGFPGDVASFLLFIPHQLRLHSILLQCLMGLDIAGLLVLGFYHSSFYILDLLFLTSLFSHHFRLSIASVYFEGYWCRVLVLAG